MASTQHGVLVEGSVSGALRRMAIPMAMGMVFMILVNIIDTFWVAQLGTEYVAAMTYTFPVVGLVINVALGIMIGTSTAVARTIGAGESKEASQLTMYAIYLALGLVVVLSGIGLLSQDWIFRLLGAKGQILALTKDYMTIWFLGMVFLMVPLVVNGVLRARGDAKTPMLVMMIGAGVNAVLDPAFIYGWGPIPEMGLEGAAIATLIARFVGMIFVFTVLFRRSELVTFEWPKAPAFIEAVRKILSVGIPAAITNALGPLAVALVTGIVAVYGAEAIAAYGIGARIDALVLMAPMSIGAALSPFVGQNWGAHLLLRVAEGIRKGLRFSLVWGMTGCVLLMVLAEPLGGLFTDDEKVLSLLVLYLQTIPIGYAFLSLASVASSAFNAVDRATRSTWLSVLRSLIFAVPAAFIGGQLAGLRGVFIGLVVASILAAFLGVRWLKTLLRPDGEISPDRGQPLTYEAFLTQIEGRGSVSCLKHVLPPILELEGMKLHSLKKNVVGFFVGERELAHVHLEGRIDLALPVEIGENLVTRGVVSHHPSHDDNGWYVHEIRNRTEVQETVWLIRLSHLLYEVSRRGIHDPITQAELDAFSASENCVAAMLASANRWAAEERSVAA